MEIKTRAFDVAVIGAGPVGLFTVFECGMLGLNCVVIDSLNEIGGQCSALYPEKPIYDIPSRPSISGGDLIAELERQAAPFDPTYILKQQVHSLSGDVEQGFTLGLKDGAIVKAGAVIIAAGAGSFGPNRPPLEGIEQCEGVSVHYMVRKPDLFQGTQVVIAGGGDSALDWANILADHAAHVTLVHRRDKFRAAEASVNAMRAHVEAGKITLMTPYQLSGLSHEQGHLKQVTLKPIGTGEEQVIPADHLLSFFGLSSDLGPMLEWGLECQDGVIPVAPNTAETRLEGVYAVGDIAGYDHKLKLILTGFSEGAMAAHHIKRRLNGGADWHMEYSTTKGIPGS